MRFLGTISKTTERERERERERQRKKARIHHPHTLTSGCEGSRLLNTELVSRPHDICQSSNHKPLCEETEDTVLVREWNALKYIPNPVTYRRDYGWLS